MLRRIGLGLGLVVASAVVLLLASVQGNAQQDTFRVNVRLVSVYVNVTDAHGAPVPDLQKSNFALTESDVPQTIAVFERQTNVPLSAALAIDTSGSKAQTAEQRMILPRLF
jgi:hypothetical protein